MLSFIYADKTKKNFNTVGDRLRDQRIIKTCSIKEILTKNKHSSLLFIAYWRRERESKGGTWELQTITTNTQ